MVRGMKEWMGGKPRFMAAVLVSGIFVWVAGTSMGIGAALARGGNDSQLLLTLPVFSPAGITAVASMLVGLYLGLRIRRPA
jgi:hypothetical protein